MTRLVDVVDLRPGASSGIDPDGPAIRNVASRIVVVDLASRSAENHSRYHQLATIGQVREIVLVLVGPMTTDEHGSPALRLSSMLGQACVTLWVGSEVGVRWEGGTDRGRQSEPEVEDGLADLLRVLGSRPVFDEVVRRVREIPFHVASPATDVVHPSVQPAELTTLLLRALRQMSGTNDQAPASEEPAAGKRAGTGTAAAVVPRSPLHRRRAAAQQRLADAVAATAALRRWNGAFTTGGDAACERVALAGAALEAHRTIALEAVSLVQRLPAPDDDALAAMGVPHPQAVDHSAVAATTGALLKGRLRSGSLLGASRALRHLANSQAGRDANVNAFTTRVALERPESARANRWSPVLAVLPVVLATCFATAALPVSGIAAGPVSAALWLGLLAFLLTRRPPGGPATGKVLAVVGATAVAGVAGGLLVPPMVPVPEPFEALVCGLSVLVSLTALVLVWRAQVDRWTSTLLLGQAATVHEGLVGLVDEFVVGRQGSADLRRRTADAALLLAGGCDDVRAVFTETCSESPVDGDVRTGNHHDLVDVIHRDLERISTTALDESVRAIASGAPLTAEPGLVALRARTLTKEYVDYLRRSGGHRRPPMGAVDARGALEEAFWEDSVDARRVLKASGREEMRQLCHLSDIRRLNPDWSGVRVIRFAPEHVLELFGVIGHEIVDTDQDVVGVLRLVPLRRDVVRRVAPPLSADPGGDL
ncbi:hypothetical protein [Umezawaea endophytica]|uniref:Uncharacterized protein n=1 Tax=Umezawaea endophytica TaxID=1654476 RepID=A0A9X2ZZJ0_9PSEU|nr:hypothetical protein [Umezawaea endophytica]MCS7477479.1 hypothetical protein [Umezawaea endophytica]